MFVVLSIHIFDYVKDVDITAIIFHFDRVVVQQAYTQYKGFNFNYLFITSVVLLFVSHIVTPIYLRLLRSKEKVLQCKEDETKMKKFLYQWLPYLPASLPVLLFCRLAELTVMLERETL